MKILKVSLSTALVFSTLSFFSFAEAAVKPGDACKKLGSNSVSVNIKFTCIASGKKLIWNKGSKIAPTILAPAPKSTPSQSPAPEATPTQAPEPFEPASLQDLIAHPEAMSYWAWKKSASKIAQATEPGPAIVMHVGPHTTVPTSMTADAITAVTRLYSGFTIPTTIHAIYYTYEDTAWAQNEFAKLALHPSGQEASGQCQTSQTCWGAMAEIDMKGNGVLLIASGVTDANHTSGTLEAHEYAHTVQQTQFMGTSKSQGSHCCIKAYLPYWAVEGGAEFAQAVAIFPKSFNAYLLERDHDTNEFVSNRDGVFTLDWIKSFLDISAINSWNDPKNNWRTYDLGFLVNEALVAIKGPDISMKLNKDVANGMSWPQAFEASMGISWTEGLPELATAIKGQLKK